MRYHSRMDDIQVENRVQARIDRILNRLFQSAQFRIEYAYSEEGISFRIDDTKGDIVGETNRETPIEVIEGMSDAELEQQLKIVFENTQRFLTEPF